MRILVTGATGFIGTWVVRALLGLGHDVVGAFRPGRDAPSEWGGAGHFTPWPAHLDDPAAVDRLAAGARPDVTVHTAWYADPRTYLRSPRNLDSLAMTVKLARALYDHGCRRFVGTGSCAEYTPQSRPLREDDSAEPATLYGVCKRAASESIAALARQEGRDFAWTRIFHVHGPGDSEYRLIPSVVGLLLRGEIVELTDGTQIRDHLHVADVGSALASVAVSDVSGIVNVCSGRAVTLRHVVETAAQAVGRGELLRFGARPRRRDEAGFVAGDASRLARLGWVPAFTLEEGLRDAVAFVQSHPPR
jgi:nucleoside-diphosphate-sugar epimerase